METEMINFSLTKWWRKITGLRPVDLIEYLSEGVRVILIFYDFETTEKTV